MSLYSDFLAIFSAAPPTVADAATSWAAALAPHLTGGAPATASALGTVKTASAPTDPANPVALNEEEATTTPTASKVPRADGSGVLSAGWLPVVFNALRGARDRVLDVANAATLWSASSASAWGGTSMGQWHVFTHAEGGANLRYSLWITRSMSSYNGGASRWHIHGIKTDAAGVTSLVSSSVAEGVSDATLYTDGVISILIGGTSTMNTGTIGLQNSSGSYMDTMIRHYSESVWG